MARAVECNPAPTASPVGPEHPARLALCEVALLADSLGAICIELLEMVPRDAHSVAQAHAAQIMAAQMGLLADMGMTSLGGEPVRGCNAGAWLLPPSRCLGGA